MAVTFSSTIGVTRHLGSSIPSGALSFYPCNETVTCKHSIRYVRAMEIPGSGLVFSFMLNVLGVIVFVGIGIGALFVWLSRRERQNKVERNWEDHDYADMPPPPPPPAS